MIIGLSSFAINRDGVFIIVKDMRKKLREELTDDEIQKYATNSFLDHL